jgi:hypothetical protein
MSVSSLGGHTWCMAPILQRIKDALFGREEQIAYVYVRAR